MNDVTYDKVIFPLVAYFPLSFSLYFFILDNVKLNVPFGNRVTNFVIELLNKFYNITTKLEISLYAVLLSNGLPWIEFIIFLRIEIENEKSIEKANEVYCCGKVTNNCCF